MTVYKASNINGKFNHLVGKAEAIAYARAVEKDESLSEQDLVKDYGWRFEKVSATEARAVGIVQE